MKKKFNIDIIEFNFLVEACIPPRPIARSMFWTDVINIHYHNMTIDERKNLLRWIQLNPSFNLDNEDCKWFYDRFDSENQYKVYSLYDNKEDIHECFMHKDEYHTEINRHISEEYIIKTEKI